MINLEKLEVESHLLKASGLLEQDKRYRAIKSLFRTNELDFMMYEINFVLDIRRGLLVLGLDCEVRRNKIVLDDYAVTKYYEGIMGLKAKVIEEKSYYQRQKGE